MGRKLDLTKKTVNNASTINKNLRPINRYQTYEEEPEEIENEEYEDEEEYENYNEPRTINNNKRRNTLMTATEIGKDMLSAKAKGKLILILKNPIVINILIIVIIIVILLLIAAYLVSIISNLEQEKYSELAGQCPTVTVVDTGCDANGENCNNKYDGEVAFEDYIAGVVAAEIGSAPNNLEYYKVAAIAARTYFYSNFQSDCEVDGNATYQAYIDVEDSAASEIIKQAVEETKGLVMVKDEIVVEGDYSSACVVNADSTYYYIRYGSVTLEETLIQKIPREWDSTKSAFQGKLASWYNMVDQSDSNYETKECPNNHDYGMTQIGALYLVTQNNYSYEDTLKYYYGNDIEIKSMNVQTSGIVNGFANPTTSIYCSSPFGNRTHPVSGEISFHSGIDISIAGGSPIYAVKDGKITRIEKNVKAINNCNYGYGNYIMISHDDGTSTLYAHMKYGTIPDSIEIGTKVTQGEQIGQVGSTGCSTGNHLHYEVQVNGSLVDPADYLDLANATGTCRR